MGFEPEIDPEYWDGKRWRSLRDQGDIYELVQTILIGLLLFSGVALIVGLILVASR